MILRTPGILCLSCAACIILFAIDAFGEDCGFWNQGLALLLCLIPTAINLAALAISRRWEWVGGVACTALGGLYWVHFWGRFHRLACACISVLLFFIGGLFLLSRSCRRGLGKRI